MVKNNRARDYAKQNEAANALHETMLEYLRTKEKSCPSKRLLKFHREDAPDQKVGLDEG